VFWFGLSLLTLLVLTAGLLGSAMAYGIIIP
jgi:hypothetical protein